MSYQKAGPFRLSASFKLLRGATGYLCLWAHCLSLAPAVPNLPTPEATAEEGAATAPAEELVVGFPLCWS